MILQIAFTRGIREALKKTRFLKDQWQMECYGVMEKDRMRVYLSPYCTLEPH